MACTLPRNKFGLEVVSIVDAVAIAYPTWKPSLVGHSRSVIGATNLQTSFMY